VVPLIWVTPVDIEDEILSRIRAAKAWNKDAKLSDFQFRAEENGSVLVNLKTSRAQLIYDDDSKLHDLEDLCLTETDFAKTLKG
jgi:hypothetical protein